MPYKDAYASAQPHKLTHAQTRTNTRRTLDKDNIDKGSGYVG